MDILGDQNSVSCLPTGPIEILNIIKHIYAYIAQRLLGFIGSRFTRLRIILVCQSKFSHIMCDQKKKRINQIKEKKHTQFKHSATIFAVCIRAF